MVDIFISYKTENRLRAEQFVKALRTEWSVWWDQDILPGQDWEDEITIHLKEARCVVVLWSQAAAQSKWVEDETLNGLGNGILIPVLLDDAPIPWIYRRPQNVSLREWGGEQSDPTFIRLIAGIRRKLDQGKKSQGVRIWLWRGCIFAHRVFAPLNGVLNWIALKMRGNGRRRLRAPLTFLGTLIAIGIIAVVGASLESAMSKDLNIDQYMIATYGPGVENGRYQKSYDHIQSVVRKLYLVELFVCIPIFAGGIVVTYKVWKGPGLK
jgi:hypothetical protein